MIKQNNFALRPLTLFVVLAISISVSQKLFAQKWKYYRHEVFATVGATNFLGELGGSDELTPKFYHTDFNIKATRPSFGVGYGFKIAERVNIKTSFIYAYLAGDDKYTENIYRKVRNLNFKTKALEGSMQFEYYWLKEKNTNSFRLKGVRTGFFNSLAGYVYAGVGGLHFTPYGELNGQWHALPPLNTEGQGLPDKNGDLIPDYEQFTLVIPYGIGFKYFLSKQLCISAEYSARTTFTDYLDDVSNVYYDNNAIRAAYGDLAADLADKNQSEFPAWTAADQQRGGPNSNDFYMFATVGLNYKFLKGKSIKPRF